MSAKAQGHLEPIFDELERRIGDRDSPMKVTDPAWPLKRAFADGETESLLSILKWLRGRTQGSPDGAKNTEDRHGIV